MEEWRNMLPYGEAFRFVDEMRRVEPPELLVTATAYGPRQALIGAHGVAGTAVVPGVLLGEQAAQTAWLLGWLGGWLKPGDRALLGRLNCIFETPVPGDAVVEAEVRALVRRGDTAGFRAAMRVDGREVAKITMAVKNLGPDVAA